MNKREKVEAFMYNFLRENPDKWYDPLSLQRAYIIEEEDNLSNTYLYESLHAIANKEGIIEVKEGGNYKYKYSDHGVEPSNNTFLIDTVLEAINLGYEKLKRIEEELERIYTKTDENQTILNNFVSNIIQQKRRLE